MDQSVAAHLPHQSKGLNPVVKGVRLSTLISKNPMLLLMMEHFDIDFVVGCRTIEEVCNDNGIELEVFMAIANLYNGTKFSMPAPTVDSLWAILTFLVNSHTYYKVEKYPQVNKLIERMYSLNGAKEVRLIDRFFQNYFSEVLEHLTYEDEVVFPYVRELISGSVQEHQGKFCSQTFRINHTDIETKLKDLKELLLAHIPLQGDRRLRRTLLLSLFQLDQDLAVHSVVEERILIPIISGIERGLQQ